MKELEIPQKEEIKEVAEIRKQQQLLLSYRPKGGIKMWEVNIITEEIKEATYAEAVVEMVVFMMPQMAQPKIVPQKTRKVIIAPNCLYYPASNKKNGFKKYLKDKLKWSTLSKS